MGQVTNTDVGSLSPSFLSLPFWLDPNTRCIKVNAYELPRIHKTQHTGEAKWRSTTRAKDRHFWNLSFNLLFWKIPKTWKVITQKKTQKQIAFLFHLPLYLKADKLITVIFYNYVLSKTALLLSLEEMQMSTIQAWYYMTGWTPLLWQYTQTCSKKKQKTKQ